MTEAPDHDRSAVGEEDAGEKASPAGTSARDNSRRVWGLSCASVLGLLLLIPAWHLYRSIRPPTSVLGEFRKRIAAAEAAGVAVTLPGFHRKYPTTSRGAAAVEEAARVTELLKWKWSDLRSFTLPGNEGATGTFTSFHLTGLVAENTGTKPEDLTTGSLRAHVRDNEEPLSRLIALSQAVPLDELGWRHSFEDLSVFEELNQRLKKGGDGLFLRLRESSRVLLPAAVYSALADGETTRAYAIVLGWGHLSRAQKVSGPSLVAAMVGVAIDGVQMEVVDELLRAAPPDRETARRLYDALDPERLRRDWLRGCEAETIYVNRALSCLAGDVATPPVTWGDVRQEWKTLAIKQFKSDWGTFVAGLTGSSPRWNPPSLSSLKGAYPELARGEIYEAIGLDAEWLLSLKGTAEAVTIGEAEKLAKDAAVAGERAAERNFAVAQAIPAFGRAAMNMRGTLAKAAVLRGVLLVRMAELESTGTQTAMPVSLEAVCEQLKQPLPLDPLADRLNTPVEYKPHPESGTYTIRHKPNRKPYVGETPVEFTGRWNPAGL